MIVHSEMLGRQPAKWLAAACILSVTLGLYFVNYSHLFRSGGTKANMVHSNLTHASTPSVPALHIDTVVLHGHIVEIEGSTDPGAVVMINGETAATLFTGNAFHHFLGPLPFGTAIITVTSQDERGGVNTQQIVATIE